MKILMLIGFAFFGICAGIWIITIAWFILAPEVSLTPQITLCLALFILLPYFAGRFLYRKMNALYCRSGLPE